MLVIALALFSLLQISTGSALTSSPVIENERVVVRAGSVEPGQRVSGAAGEDSYAVFIDPGSVRTPGGTLMHEAGDVVFTRAGDPAPEVVGAAVRVMIVTLHKVDVPPLANDSGYPEGFPRPGATKVFENDRVVIWDYTFTPGQPSPMHFHSRDTVVLYSGDGAVTSTTPEGVSTVNEHPPGHITFNRRNRTHTEVVSRGSVHIVATELK
jgi:hypothetical protein